MEDGGGEKDAVVDGDKNSYDIDQFDILKFVGKGEEFDKTGDSHVCLYFTCRSFCPCLSLSAPAFLSIFCPEDAA
jgi:hypothetical protein